jgi:hypothetical protein
MRTTNRTTAALKFVLMIGVLSFFTDFTYEGSVGWLNAILGQRVFTLSAWPEACFPVLLLSRQPQR